MKKEQIIALGIPETVAIEVARVSKEELKSFIPKIRFDELNQAKKKLEKEIVDKNLQLEELKKSTSTSEELKRQIEILRVENRTVKEKYEANLKELAITNAIKGALVGKVHDEALVLELIDRSKLDLVGEKVIGLEEQLKKLQEHKGFLFKTNVQLSIGLKIVAGNHG